MAITDVIGLTEAQRAALKVLGAVEETLKALRDEDGYVTSGDYWRRLS